MNQTIRKRIEDINNGIVPEGYKQTPFGIFPCDWEATSIGEVSINKGEYGLNASACEYEVGLPKYIRITDIDDNGNYVDTGACVNFQDETKQYTLKDRDIVFARTGATVGRNYLYKEKDGELLYAGFLIKFSIDKKEDLPGFSDILGLFIKGIKYFLVTVAYNIIPMIVLVGGISYLFVPVISRNVSFLIASLAIKAIS